MTNKTKEIEELQYKIDNYRWKVGEMSSNGIYRNITEREVAIFLDWLKQQIQELREKKQNE